MEPDPLQCPRCNSSNTKFCYYNNYSLSQPRHFCKACKRYWTRGGTLRNVPVGGGYRKNKKFKRHPPPAAAVGGGRRLAPAAPVPDTSNRINNPFIHNLPTNFPLELNFPFSETRVSSHSPIFDDRLRKNHSGVEFSSYFRNGYEQNIEDRADFISFGSSNFAQLRQRSNEFPSLMRYEDVGMVVGNEQIGKESNVIQYSNQIEQINNSSSFSWNPNNLGVWFDPSSSSLPSI